MESTNKENLNPEEYPIGDDVKNYSVDSLEDTDETPKEQQSTALTANIIEPLLPNNDQEKPLAPDGDIASNRQSDITREVEQYSEDLARELINSVKQQGDKEPEREEVKTTVVTEIQEEIAKIEKQHSETQEDEHNIVNEEDKLIQVEQEETSKPEKLARVDSNIIKSDLIEEKVDEPTVEPIDKNITHNSNPDDSPTIAKTNFEAHQTFQTAAGNSFENSDLLEESGKMEFTKNYSDDLLMGQADNIQSELVSGGADLADFELPPYSGSSSGSEPRQQSPAKQRKTSSSSSATAQASGSQSVNPPDLSAVKNLLCSSYARVSHVFHWKKPVETGIFFLIGLTLIRAFTFFSIISVVAYSALGIILASGLIRVYKAVMKTLDRSQETPFDHIWDKVLKINVSLSPTTIHELIDASLGSFNSSLVYFKQVLLVEDKLATFKFALALYLLTYIGAWFNGMTLITIGYLSLFSAPILYEKNKAKIDGLLGSATSQASSAISMLTNKVTSLVFRSSPAPSGSGVKKQN